MRVSLVLVLGLSACIESGINRVEAPPEAWISEPVADSVLRQSEVPIALAGGVADEYDLPNTLDVQWVLDDGAPMTAYASAEGVVFGEIPGDLALGEHHVRLDALDSDGMGTSVSVTFSMIGPPGAPTVNITAPDDGSSALVGDAITFVGEASDLSTELDDLSFAWVSSIDGALTGEISGGGRSALFTNTLSLGEHTITLFATDSDGEVGQDSIVVSVMPVEETDPEEPQEPEPGDLIFTEFMVNPNAAADEDGEWVELYNTSGSTLDIVNYSFHDDDTDSWTFDASVLVAPHSYIVLCANPDPRQNGGVPCDGWFFRNPNGVMPPSNLGHGTGVAIANNDDELSLTSPTGVDIDLFDYNDTDSDPIEAEMSFGLDPGCLDGVCNDDIDNWCVQTSLQSGMSEPGTPGLPNDPCF